jgi:cytochrome bd-type quinol oxidase subunit 2
MHGSHGGNLGALVAIFILVGGVITTFGVLVLALRSVKDASNDSQSGVLRRSIRTVALLAAVGLLVAFAATHLIAAASHVNSTSGAAFGMWMGCALVALLPAMVAAAWFGRRYRQADEAPNPAQGQRHHR